MGVVNLYLNLENSKEIFNPENLFTQNINQKNLFYHKIILKPEKYFNPKNCKLTNLIWNKMPVEKLCGGV